MQDNTCVCCGKIIPEGGHTCLACMRENDMQTFGKEIRTNGDRIRAMSDAQLADFIITALSAKAIECDYCIHRDELCRNKRSSRRCTAGMVAWIRSEVRDE